MASTFFAGIDRLSREVGHGTLRGKVTVDQVYAKAQELREDYSHPEGGEVHYLRNSLFEDSDKRMEGIAARAITPDGSEIKDAVKDATEDLVRGVYKRAPLEFGDLKGSGAPAAYDDGAVYYERPANVGRLTRDELRAKGRLRNLFRFERDSRGF